MEDDLAEVKERTEALRNRKEMNKAGRHKSFSKSEPNHGVIPTFDSTSAKRAIESFAKLFGKVKRKMTKTTDLEEGQEEETPTRSWLRKYYRRLG